MERKVGFCARLGWRLGRTAAIITWPARAPVLWLLSWKTENKAALTVFLLGLAIAWLAGVNFTERGPGIAFAVFFSLMLSFVARIFPYKDLTS